MIKILEFSFLHPRPRPKLGGGKRSKNGWDSLPGQPQDSTKPRSFRAASVWVPWLAAGHERRDCSPGRLLAPGSVDASAPTPGPGQFSGWLQVTGMSAPPPDTVTLARCSAFRVQAVDKGLSSLVGNSLHHNTLLNRF